MSDEQAQNQSLPLALAAGLAPFPGLTERIVQSARVVVALETARPDELIEQLRHTALRHGRAIYVWNPSAGIGSLREPGVFVPGTRRLADALRHIEASQHFGIYLFHPMSALGLLPDSLALRVLRRLFETDAEAGPARRVVLMDRYVGIDPEMDATMDRIFDRPGRGRLRLRQGRWVG